MTESDQAELKRLMEWLNRVFESVAGDRARIAELERRLAELEAKPSPAGGLVTIPFAQPPLLRNKGSWDDSDILALHNFSAAASAVTITIGNLEDQKESRVVRRDFGLQDPHLEPGRGGFLREPEGVLRRYELSVTVPDPYDNRAEMTNLFQMHTESTKDPPIISFFLWTKDAYIRHNLPQGTRVNYNLGAIKPGHTYALAVEALWSDENHGQLRAWVDGERIVDYLGPNFKGGPPYVILGPYAPSAVKEFSNTFILSDLRVGDV